MGKWALRSAASSNTLPLPACVRRHGRWVVCRAEETHHTGLGRPHSSHWQPGSWPSRLQSGWGCIAASFSRRHRWHRQAWGSPWVCCSLSPNTSCSVGTAIQQQVTATHLHQGRMCNINGVSCCLSTFMKFDLRMKLWPLARFAMHQPATWTWPSSWYFPPHHNSAPEIGDRQLIVWVLVCSPGLKKSCLWQLFGATCSRARQKPCPIVWG